MWAYSMLDEYVSYDHGACRFSDFNPKLQQTRGNLLKEDDFLLSQRICICDMYAMVDILGTTHDTVGGGKLYRGAETVQEAKDFSGFYEWKKSGDNWARYLFARREINDKLEALNDKLEALNETVVEVKAIAKQFNDAVIDKTLAFRMNNAGELVFTNKMFMAMTKDEGVAYQFTENFNQSYDSKPRSQVMIEIESGELSLRGVDVEQSLLSFASEEDDMRVNERYGRHKEREFLVIPGHQFKIKGIEKSQVKQSYYDENGLVEFMNDKYVVKLVLVGFVDQRPKFCD